MSVIKRVLPVECSIADVYMTREQFAEEMSVSVRTIDRWHDHREGPPRVQIGRKVLYDRAAVHAWLKSREIGRTPGSSQDGT